MGRPKVVKTMAKRKGGSGSGKHAMTQCYGAGPDSKEVAWRGIQELWRNQQLCDVELLVEDKTFPAHRCYLASSCQYFHSMFTGTFKEAKANKVQMTGITVRGLEATLLYLYTGFLKITEDNISDIIQACSLLQIMDIHKLCEQFVKDELCTGNYLTFYLLFDAYAMEGIKDEVMKYILREFSSISQQDSFLALSLDLLCELLQNDMLHAESELVVFRAATRWLNAEPGRQEHAERVLSHLRFGLMSKEEMEEVNMSDIMHQPSCRGLLGHAFNYHMNIFEQVMIDTPIARVRTPVLSVLMFGGLKHDKSLNEILYAKIVEGKNLANSVAVGKLPDGIYNAEVAVVNNFVFLVGGQTQYGSRGEHATNGAYRYNPRDGTWLQVASMKTARTRFALVAMSEFVFAVGGVTEKTLVTASVERYSLKENNWSKGRSNVGAPVCDMAGCAHGGKLYISGGNGSSKNMLCSDDGSGTWQLKSPLLTGRAFHAMVTYKDTIFVCGGTTVKDNVCRHVTDTDIYNVATDQWSRVAPISQGIQNPSVACCNSSIFLLGGYDYVDKRHVNIIQQYDLEKNKWVVLDTNDPELSHGIAATCVKIPRTRFGQISKKGRRGKVLDERLGSGPK